MVIMENQQQFVNSSNLHRGNSQEGESSFSLRDIIFLIINNCE